MNAKQIYQCAYSGYRKHNGNFAVRNSTAARGAFKTFAEQRWHYPHDESDPMNTKAAAYRKDIHSAADLDQAKRLIRIAYQFNSFFTVSKAYEMSK